MTLILIDTNLLMAIEQFNIDIFSELERISPEKCAVLDKSIDELKKLAAQKGKTKSAAQLALKIVIAKKIHIIKSESELQTDDILAQLSHEGMIVATQDRELQKRLKRPYIVMRSRSHLELIE